MNTALFEKLINDYNRLSFTHKYIFGFNYKGTIYMVFTTASVLPYVLTLDKASRNSGYSIRFSPTNKQKEYLLAKGAKAVSSTIFFDEITSASIYNRGEMFEKMVYDMFGQEWKKDNVPFTKAGDIMINNVHYQIKFEKATFINEKTLSRLG